MLSLINRQEMNVDCGQVVIRSGGIPHTMPGSVQFAIAAPMTRRFPARRGRISTCVRGVFDWQPTFLNSERTVSVSRPAERLPKTDV